MKEYLHTPKRVVNIKNIKELEGIQKTGAGLRIGALVTMDELAKNADVKSGYKSLADAAAGIPSPQIRHMGTAGGDLCQRPRCWYYRQGFGLLAMKDGKPLVPVRRKQVPRHSSAAGRRISSARPAWGRRWWPWGPRSNWFRPRAAAKCL